MHKILLFTPICKPKQVLEVSLPSYLELNTESIHLDILFFDDNKKEVDSRYLNEFAKPHSNVSFLDLNINKSVYKDHLWSNSDVDRIIHIKNSAISYALENNYDFLFLVDADLVLNPNTLQQLLSLNKDFVFEVFWTLFFREHYYKPNAWDKHSWSYTGPETLLKLSEKGTYKVGGGGACTLLSNEILKKGVNFTRIQNLSYNGEDRHICTRAQVMGYDVFVDTNYPCYHIFNSNQANEAKLWYDTGAKPEFFLGWLNLEWRHKVISSFTKKSDLFSRLKRFQYEIRVSFLRSFKKNILNKK